MNKHIFVIDDQKEQAIGLAKQLNERLTEESYFFEALHDEHDILQAIDDRFCSLAIVDLRMDDYEINGIDICRKIIDNNPLAKVIIVSSWLTSFQGQYQDLITSGHVLCVMEKESLPIWVPKIEQKLREFFTKQEDSLSENSKMLLNAYERAKNEKIPFKKGKLFEEFLVNLFGQIGFQFIQKRVTDTTSEVDLILRNDINDAFLSKFGKYIFVEAKNRPSSPVDKNDFLAFRSKLDSSNQLAELGIIAASHNIASSVRLEALRTSREAGKIILLANDELTRLILAEDKRYELKKLIDTQIKDLPH